MAWQYDRSARLHTLRLQRGTFLTIERGRRSYALTANVSHGTGLFDFSTRWLGEYPTLPAAKRAAQRYQQRG